MVELPSLLVCASGGGSGFENLLKAIVSGVLRGKIVGLFTDVADCGAVTHAERWKVPVLHHAGPYTDEGNLAAMMRGRKLWGDRLDLICASGYLPHLGGYDPTLDYGFNPASTINIHPGLLPATAALHGIHVHERAMELYLAGRITHTAVSMHFVTEKWDDGPRFISYPVRILTSDTPEILGNRVNAAEHFIQPLATNWVLQKLTGWDGQDPSTFFVHPCFSNIQIPVAAA